MKLINVITVAFIVALPAMAGARPVQTEFHSVIYTCERNVRLPVIFVNDPQGRRNLVAMIEGRLVTLTQNASASGARYRHENPDAQSYEIWSKGDKARVSYGTDKESKVIFEECVELKIQEKSASQDQ